MSFLRFYIKVEIERRYRTYAVERVFYDGRKEHFKVIAKNGSFTIESNRPLFRNRGLKYRKPDFQIIEGKLPYSNLLQIFVDAIMKVVDV